MPIDPRPSLRGPTEGLRQFLDLGVAQLDAAMRESDAHVARLTQVLSGLAGELRACEDSPEPLDVRTVEALRTQVHAAVQGLEFYDKLTQRLTHVRDGLAIPADALANAPVDAMAKAMPVAGDTTGTDWQEILQQVRNRYSLVEERVLFDFMMCGLSTTEMLKALRSLREAVGLPRPASET